MNLNDAFLQMIKSYWEETEDSPKSQSDRKYDKKYFDAFEEDVLGPEKKAKSEPIKKKKGKKDA